MANYPTLSIGYDASSFAHASENPAHGSDTEGGYQVTRPRFTRTPRKTFRFTHVDITEADRVTLETFWNVRKGSSESFTWTHPVTGASYTVRFALDMKTLEFTRTGYGTNHRWDSSEIILTEV